MRDVKDRYLPPDHDAFVEAEPPTGRVIVIAPTRAACETIELAVGLHIETYLEKHFGARVRELARPRDQSRARGDAGDPQLEHRHRHDRHRATVVPGRGHPAAGHADRGRDSP